MKVEQAIFTSARTSQRDGYQLVGCSPDVCEDDRRELSAWGPSHDSLIDAPAPQSVNFHPLPSGAYAVARTVPAGAEYSHRRGRQVYTQTLIVEPELLLEFSNNPFALISGAIALNHFEVHQRVPERLEAIELSLSFSPLDTRVVGQAVSEVGLPVLGQLIDAMLQHEPLGIVSRGATQTLVAAAVNCLPVPCRPLISFSTGLKFSSRRPFRVFALEDDAAEQRRLERQSGVTVFDASAPPAELPAADGWGAFVLAMLEEGRVDELSDQLAQARAGLTLEEVPGLVPALR